MLASKEHHLRMDTSYITEWKTDHDDGRGRSRVVFHDGISLGTVMTREKGIKYRKEKGKNERGHERIREKWKHWVLFYQDLQSTLRKKSSEDPLPWSFLAVHQYLPREDLLTR